MTRIVTDPTVLDPSNTVTTYLGLRHMTPELLNLTKFGLTDNSPSKENDVHWNDSL